MKTLTLFIDNLYALNLGAEEYQVVKDITLKSESYDQLTLAGSRFSEVVFEEIIFIDCTFFSTHFENCLFINCLFINCKFQFSQFNNCNFEASSWENCIWGLSSLRDSEILQSEALNNVSFESQGPESWTTSLNLGEILALSA